VACNAASVAVIVVAAVCSISNSETAVALLHRTLCALIKLQLGMHIADIKLFSTHAAPLELCSKNNSTA
jgi:hypothetical protein